VNIGKLKRNIEERKNEKFMKYIPMKLGKSKDDKEMHYSAGVIVECNGKYLMLDRKNPPPGFACPAGHIDEGEEPKIAAIREVFEETGIKLEDVEFVCEEEVPWNYCKSGVEVHYWYLYKASTLSENFVLEEEEEKSLAWYTVEEIKKLNIEPVWKYWFEKLKII
jgi:8-oxo-dGTP pyrophosphatase MutT (NUDIX family)